MTTTTKAKKAATPRRAKKKVASKASSKQTKPKAVPPRKGSLAEFMDTIVTKEADADSLKTKLETEAKKRGVRNPGLAGLRAHVRFRQARGKLTDVNINW